MNDGQKVLRYDGHAGWYPRRLIGGLCLIILFGWLVGAGKYNRSRFI